MQFPTDKRLYSAVKMPGCWVYGAKYSQSTFRHNLHVSMRLHINILCIHVSAYPHPLLSKYPCFHVSMYLHIHVSTYLHVHVFTYPCIHVSTYPRIFLSPCLETSLWGTRPTPFYKMLRSAITISWKRRQQQTPPNNKQQQQQQASGDGGVVWYGFQHGPDSGSLFIVTSLTV